MSKIFRLSFSVLLLIFLASYQAFFQFDASDFMWGVTERVPLNKMLMIACVAWLLIESIGLLKKMLLRKFDITREDNLKSRKLHTQINLLEKVIVFIIIITAMAAIMMSIDSIREIGIGIFASAGVVGIIVGLSAQKIVGAILAGIQIAITQPFRIDDAVVVENEWGWIEEINLTYIVIRLWDKRRLVLPSTYFLEKPFQNWTRSNADIIGSVFLYADYSLPVDALRHELDRILENCELWDGKVKVVQVTDSKENYMEIRVLVSAKNSPTAWDLRVYVREQLIAFIRDKYPLSLPQTRISFKPEKNTIHSPQGE
ncbi:MULTISPECIES: mechanosensitive ion channel family protein [unclassified Carboxylicivirga]|uniref:mechanosensitive ion channel family protein n=1 Tax=Carboxylicivirga TaxID=1628153 RepID=UPI003D3537D5